MTADWRDQALADLLARDVELDAKGYSSGQRDLAWKRAVNWSASMAGQVPEELRGAVFAAHLAQQLPGAETWLDGQVSAAAGGTHQAALERAVDDHRYGDALTALGVEGPAATARWEESIGDQVASWSERVAGKRRDDGDERP